MVTHLKNPGSLCLLSATNPFFCPSLMSLKLSRGEIEPCRFSLRLSLLAVQLRGEIEPCRFSLRLSLLAVQLRGEIGAPSQYETAGKTLVEFA
jgi:hypothetical protein